MARKSRSELAKLSEKAVSVAGTRERRAPVESAGTWREARGKLPASETFRPGKSKAKRRGGS